MIEMVEPNSTLLSPETPEVGASGRYSHMRVRAAVIALTLVTAACGGSSSGVEVTNSDAGSTDAPTETTADDDGVDDTVDDSTTSNSDPDSAIDGSDAESSDAETPDNSVDAPSTTTADTISIDDSTDSSTDTTPVDTTGTDSTSPSSDPVTSTDENDVPEPNDDPPATNSGEFPPTDADWADDPLARLIPTPEEVGSQWVYSDGSVVDAEPSDPEDAIPGCDVAPPATLAGIDVAFEPVNADETFSFDEIEVALAEGSASEAEAFLNSLIEITDCEIDDIDAGISSYDLVAESISGADQSAVITTSFSFDPDSEDVFVLVIAAARYDGLIIAAFSALEGNVNDDPAEQIDYVVDLVELMADKR